MMKRLTFMAMLAFSAPVHAADRDYQWHRVEWDENRIEYGVPGTDDRLLVIACNENGVIDFWGAMPGDNWDFVEGGKTEVILRSRTLREQMGGEMREAGNGINFMLTLTSDSPFLAWLGAGESIEISRADGGYKVSGNGGEQLIRRVVAACRK